MRLGGVGEWGRGRWGRGRWGGVSPPNAQCPIPIPHSPFLFPFLYV